MTHFSRRLKTMHGMLTFYFNRTVIQDTVGYHVSVMHRKNHLHTFLIKNETGRWKLENPSTVENWMADLEDMLEREILAQSLIIDYTIEN